MKPTFHIILSHLHARISLFFAIAVLSFNTVSGQIVVDQTATGSVKESKNLTVNHTVTSGLSNSVVVVSLLMSTPLNTLNNLTYDGLNLTFVESSKRGSLTLVVYTLINPPSGTNALTINTINKTDIILAVTSFGNVDQDNIFSSIQKENGNSGNISKAIVCNENSFALDFLSLEDKTATEGPGQTVLFNHLNPNGADRLLSSYKLATSGTDNLSWNFSGTNYNYIWGCLNAAPPPMIDFDGVDDYLSTSSIINGLNEVTIMAWVKSDIGNSTDMVIAGEDEALKLWFKNANKPTFSVKIGNNGVKTVGGFTMNPLNFNQWHNITGTFSSSTGLLKIYVDGVLEQTKDTGIIGEAIAVTSDSNGTFEIGRFSNNLTNGNYFKGDIDEVRVFNSVLTDSQLQQIIYQEIEDNSGTVRGKVINKDVIDVDTDAPLLWANLKLYYRMGTEFTPNYKVIDYSGNLNHASIFNITSWQEETAPMPYVATLSGDWSNETTWLHGNAWDIEDPSSIKDWMIVRVSDDITVNHDVKTAGLIIDSGKTLTVTGDHLIQNSWYLELNGTLDLEDDSQLIQTEHSDLVTSADGKILRRQEGVASSYWYNYWGSPVGAPSATSLSDNNTSSNNPNNTDFRLELLKDSAGLPVQFTSSYSQAGYISTYWLYTFMNGVTYWDWARLQPTTGIKSGVGYTQKGTDSGGLDEQYIFEGKPNNGTILVDVTDAGGPGSVVSESATNYLFGNPYPSALDIHKFIDDNAGVISGTLQLWQQWSGSSHYLNEYNGGYAQVNKLGSTRAYQFEGIEGASSGSQDGTKTPTRYLPVGQGFIAEVIADGQVVFNNTQRVFTKEADVDGTYNNGSVFMKSGNTKSKKADNKDETEEADPFQKIRLEFNSVTGPETRRELLLGFSEITSDDFDYGYDAECGDSNNNDLNLNFEGKNMNIQAYGPITDDKVVPLNFKSSGDNSFEIKVTALENMAEGQKIYLRDHLTGDYFDLTTEEPYQFNAAQGKFNNRFELVFQSENQTLSAEEVIAEENFIYYQQKTKLLYAKKLKGDVQRFALVNTLGQNVMELADVSQSTLESGLQIPNVSTGTYIAVFRTDDNQVVTKKIIVN